MVSVCGSLCNLANKDRSEHEARTGTSGVSRRVASPCSRVYFRLTTRLPSSPHGSTFEPVSLNQGTRVSIPTPTASVCCIFIGSLRCSLYIGKLDPFPVACTMYSSTMCRYREHNAPSRLYLSTVIELPISWNEREACISVRSMGRVSLIQWRNDATRKVANDELALHTEGANGWGICSGHEAFHFVQ